MLEKFLYLFISKSKKQIDMNNGFWAADIHKTITRISASQKPQDLDNQCYYLPDYPSLVCSFDLDEGKGTCHKLKGESQGLAGKEMKRMI